MALVECPECQSEVSTKAYECPKCGLPNPGEEAKKVAEPDLEAAIRRADAVAREVGASVEDAGRRAREIAAEHARQKTRAEACERAAFEKAEAEPKEEEKEEDPSFFEAIEANPLIGCAWLLLLTACLSCCFLSL